MKYLAPLGVLPIPQDVAPGPVEELLGRYRAWLLVERGVTPGTARGYVDCVRPFVAGRLHGGVLDLAGVSAGDVTGFVLSVCPGRAVGSAKLIVCSGDGAPLPTCCASASWSSPQTHQSATQRRGR